MSPSDFCLWLRALLDKQTHAALTREEAALIRENLSEVFQHDIDPQMGNEAHQAMLNQIHSRPSQKE